MNVDVQVALTIILHSRSFRHVTRDACYSGMPACGAIGSLAVGICIYGRTHQSLASFVVMCVVVGHRREGSVTAHLPSLALLSGRVEIIKIFQIAFYWY